jgi:hypothetical protein
VTRGVAAGWREALATAMAAGVRRGQVTRLVISSGGGDTVAGRHVGRWVREMFEVLAARQGVNLADELGKYAPEELAPTQRAAFVQEFLQSLATTRPDEADFYARLGLSDAFAVCAVGDVLERRPGYAGQIGWGFSLADMARLGLANTVYLGEGRYEANSARFRQYLVPLGADECPALLT